MTKLEALAKFLDCPTDYLFEESEDTFSLGSKEYLVLTDSEADEKCAEDIKNSLWAFNANFLAAHLKDGIEQDVVEAIQGNNKCESNNAAILSLIDDIDHLISDAIAADGRGHFLSSYDGEEHEQGELFIYRTN